MNWLCEGALTVLERVYSAETGLFPYTNRLDGDRYRSVFDHPQTMLSTVNCLLGLQEAARHSPGHPFLHRIGEMTETFLRLHEHALVDPGVHGLLTVLLAESDDHPQALGRSLARIRATASDDAALRRLNTQQLSWLLWGAVAAGRRGEPDAEPTADRLFAALTSHFVKPGEALARHTSRRGRGAIVSFGSCVYYLRATYCYGTLYGSAKALEMFDRGVAALLAGQGPQGEWPWLVSSKDGRPLDFYPVFSVHQHSMSMLFLFPARQRDVPGVSGAVDRSLPWITGKNQLGRPMVRSDRFFIYRSHERRAWLARPERFVRAQWMLLSNQRAGLVPEGRLTVNTESRSYELGWILYVLSGAGDLAGIG